jgi:hypothetical protein
MSRENPRSVSTGKDSCLRHSHGGTGCGSTHKPFLPSRASFSSPSSTVFPGA